MVGITGWEHVGIRVCDRAQSLAFYEALGFREVADLPEHQANEMENAAGIRINLIFNGVARTGARNVLQDEPVKWAGVTHAAFVVASLDELMTVLDRSGITITITEGPLAIGRRRTLFIRDPDGTVLEFNEIPGSGGDGQHGEATS